MRWVAFGGGRCTSRCPANARTEGDRSRDLNGLCVHAPRQRILASRPQENRVAHTPGSPPDYARSADPTPIAEGDSIALRKTEITVRDNNQACGVHEYRVLVKANGEYYSSERRRNDWRSHHQE
jgi:hypothetical protein